MPAQLNTTLSTAALALLVSIGIGLTRPPVASQAAVVSPVTIGDHVAGSFADASGHSAQSHLIYAVNSRVWWLFTLSSTADAEGGSNHVVKAFRSSGPDLATATWIAAGDSPAAASGTPNGFLGGGRSLAIAYIDNTPVDVIHAEVSMAFDGQDGRTGHIRAVVTGTAITWSSWNYFDEPAATWTLPRGNTLGVSSGKFIHTAGPILQQEVDANARQSTNPDTGGTWTSGFSAPVVVDNSMTNQANALAFAPLASDTMLVVYDNGQSTEPLLTNLRYKRSNAGGSWSGVVVGSQLGGDGNVFATNAAIDQNDWALVPVSDTRVYVFRRTANGSGLDAAAYNDATNTWSPLSPGPPLFGAAQSPKPGAGVFGATDGSGVWVCVINSDLANSILCTSFDGAAWTPWTAVPGTDIGTQTRSYLSGSARVGNNQVGLVWTEGSILFDVVTASLSLAAPPPPPRPQTPLITWPAPRSIVTGTPLGPAQLNATANTAGTFVYSPPAGTVLPGGRGQTLAVAFTPLDAAAFTTAAATVTIDVVNIVPNVVGLPRSAATAAIAAAGLAPGTEAQASSAIVPAGSVIDQKPAAGTQVLANTPVSLLVSSGPPVVTPAPHGAISIDFAGTSTALIAPAEIAGVVPKPNWNNATGASSSSPLPLVDETGAATNATVGWSSNGGWILPIADGGDNVRLMKGYLDTTSTSTTTVTVSGLAPNTYDVYVYADGDNRTYDRSANYSISGAGVTPSTITLIDAANTNFGTAFTRGDNSRGNYVRFTITATGFTLSAAPNAPSAGTRRAPVNGMQIVPAPAAPAPQPANIGIRFAGTSPAAMGDAEIAGVVPASHWNNAAGAVRTAPLALVDDGGQPTAATVTWAANGGWTTPVADQPGDARLMKGYLDTSSISVTTVTVAGLARGAYDVYVYIDGDNRQFTRAAAYRLSGAGLAPMTMTVADPANTNFAGAYVEATPESGTGNYVKFRITADGFSLTATPVSSTNLTLRAPVNAIQIVKVAP